MCESKLQRNLLAFVRDISEKTQVAQLAMSSSQSLLCEFVFCFCCRTSHLPDIAGTAGGICIGAESEQTGVCPNSKCWQCNQQVYNGLHMHTLVGAEVQAGLLFVSVK